MINNNFSLNQELFNVDSTKKDSSDSKTREEITEKLIYSTKSNKDFTFNNKEKDLNFNKELVNLEELESLKSLHLTEVDLISSVIFELGSKFIILESNYKKLLSQHEETCMLLNKSNSLNSQLNKEKSIFTGLFTNTNSDKLKLSWIEKEKSKYYEKYS